MPNDLSPSGYCLHISSCKNCSRTCKGTSNQSWAFPQTFQNSSGSNSNGSEAIMALPLQPPAMLNSPSLPGNSLYPNFHGKQWELVEIHPIKCDALTTPPKTTPASFFMINLSRCVTTPTSHTTSHLSRHYLHGAITFLNEPSHAISTHHHPAWSAITHCNLHNVASSPNEPPH